MTLLITHSDVAASDLAAGDPAGSGHNSVATFIIQLQYQ
jgi:hypothetical protein